MTDKQQVLIRDNSVRNVKSTEYLLLQKFKQL